MKILFIDHVQLAMPAGEEEKNHPFFINLLQPPLDGYKRARIFDPFGSRIELMQKMK